jgi:hypothetical protein
MFVAHQTFSVMALILSGGFQLFLFLSWLVIHHRGLIFHRLFVS